ncbi:MAG: MHYT domain-containing protein [Paracoccaceae bacterium]
MDYLTYSHNHNLVILSLILAVVSGFTGFTLTQNLSAKTLLQRKISVSMAAVALGGGIWSMHFVAMLGLNLPVMVFYDAAITLASALIAILIVAVALMILHFFVRTSLTIVLAGCIVGAGILLMHYIGMAGLQLCKPIYTAQGLVLSSGVAFFSCIVAFWVAYKERNNRNIFFATLCFGVAVVSVHFLAILNTRFVEVSARSEFGPLISNETLAVIVVLSSFIILCLFLWVSATFLSPHVLKPKQIDDTKVLSERTKVVPQHIPCERDGLKVFITLRDVLAIRADGHYSQVYTEKEKYFCVWPITEVNRRLESFGFIKVHRSYIVNPARVDRFERLKDKGYCVFGTPLAPKVPVSRSKLKAAQAAIISTPGVIGAK